MYTQAAKIITCTVFKSSKITLLTKYMNHLHVCTIVNLLGLNF